jgi:hypothetical protein
MIGISTLILTFEMMIFLICNGELDGVILNMFQSFSFF